MSLAQDLAGIPQYKRGLVFCHTCGNEQKINGVSATLGGGWPKCCTQTMSLDTPEERAAHVAGGTL